MFSEMYIVHMRNGCKGIAWRNEGVTMILTQGGITDIIAILDSIV
jgi:hypothetical protein